MGTEYFIAIGVFPVDDVISHLIYIFYTFLKLKYPWN